MIETDQKTWTVLSLVNWSSGYLAGKGFEDPRLNAELLLSHVLWCGRIDLYANFDKPLMPRDLAAYKSTFRRRLDHEPIQYIIGEAEFMGLRFLVDRRVLIPRPETEILAQELSQIFRSSAAPSRSVLDIGTGSGNIAIFLAKSLDNVYVDAVDISSEALEVARANARRHGVEGRIRFQLCDVLKGDCSFPGERYDALVSNPPYIALSEFSTLAEEIRNFEPPLATTDRADGLTFYGALGAAGKKVLSKGGRIFVEVADGQADRVRSIFQALGYAEIEAVADYNRTERVIKARRM